MFLFLVLFLFSYISFYNVRCQHVNEPFGYTSDDVWKRLENCYNIIQYEETLTDNILLYLCITKSFRNKNHPDA